MERLSNSYQENVAYLRRILRVDENFDVISRTLYIGNDEATFFYIDGFVKDDTMQKLMQHFISLKDLGTGAHPARKFANGQLPHVEVDIHSDPEQLIFSALSGAVVMLGSVFGDEGIVIDARSYPARGTEEPDSDRVMQGAKDGFVETLVYNTALLRRRIRDPRLTMCYKNAGGRSKTDLVLCYMDGIADPKFVAEISARLDKIRPESLTMGHASLAESLIRRRWYNPFPKIRMLERPDAAAAEILEGKILILCDTSPQVLVLPTSIFDFWQETNDYYFPPLTGCYLRLVRHFVFALALLLTPTWYLILHYASLLPAELSFLIPAEPGALPILLQLLLAEIAIDGLKLASMNTPNMLSTSMSVIGGLILGDFAVEIGWLCSDVIFYMAVVAIATFSHQNYEIGYAFKFLRIILLIFTGMFRIYGYVAGLLLLPVLICTNETIGGRHRYLYPLFPFNARAFGRLFFRRQKDDFEADPLASKKGT